MKKRLSVFLLVLLVSLSVGVVFAFWDSLQVEKTNSITIGEGVTLEVDVVATVPLGAILVPSGSVMKANDVDSVVLTYNVKLDKAAVADLNLNTTVVAGSTKIGGDIANAGLVNIVITPVTTTVNASNVLVTITVSLTAPADSTVYTAIINKPITFTLMFTASIA